MNKGARYQIVVLKVFPNKELKVGELNNVKQYLGSNYVVVANSYGSSKNSMVKLVEKMLEKDLLFSPKNTCYQIIDAFTEKGIVTYGELNDYTTRGMAKKFNLGVSKTLKTVFGNKETTK